jgi:hypothetical protein
MTYAEKANIAETVFGHDIKTMVNRYKIAGKGTELQTLQDTLAHSTGMAAERPVVPVAEKSGGAGPLCEEEAKGAAGGAAALTAPSPETEAGELGKALLQRLIDRRKRPLPSGAAPAPPLAPAFKKSPPQSW